VLGEAQRVLAAQAALGFGARLDHGGRAHLEGALGATTRLERRELLAIGNQTFTLAFQYA
jgi:hypothetical protein